MIDKIEIMTIGVHYDDNGDAEMSMKIHFPKDHYHEIMDFIGRINAGRQQYNDFLDKIKDRLQCQI